jgi:hypothetical protein
MASTERKKIKEKREKKFTHTHIYLLMTCLGPKIYTLATKRHKGRESFRI